MFFLANAPAVFRLEVGEYRLAIERTICSKHMKTGELWVQSLKNLKYLLDKVQSVSVTLSIFLCPLPWLQLYFT